MLWLKLQIKCWCGEVGSVDNELSTRERLLIFVENIYIKNTWSSTRDVLVEISMGKNQRIDFFYLSWLVSTRTQPCIAALAQTQTESTCPHEVFYCVQLKDDTLALLTCFPYSFMPAEKLLIHSWQVFLRRNSCRMWNQLCGIPVGKTFRPSTSARSSWVIKERTFAGISCLHLY